jgi:outer membrane protein OmpA-like peptidoglycan-associated protein
MRKPSKYRQVIGYLVLCCTFWKCAAESRIITRESTVQTKIDQAKKAGAYQCSPRELALAQANLEFAQTERNQGDGERAEEHLDVAQASVEKAILIGKNCNWKETDIAPPVTSSLSTAESSAPKDTDGDTIIDDVDRCPFDAEDRDGFLDEDGCPDVDNDHDGITDQLDRCPNDPGIAQNSGCPRMFSKVEVKRDRIEIKQQIFFRTGKAIIQGKESWEVLDQIAQALQDHPEIKEVLVEGHTDSSGSDSVNQRLSMARAKAVKNSLIERGVEAHRLQAEGFGSSQPIASNATKEGRDLNRRTEFRLLKRD